MGEIGTDVSTLNTEDVVQLVRLAAAGTATGSQAFLRRLARKYRAAQPTIAAAIVDALRDGPLRSVTQGEVIAHPVDNESRLPLVRQEDPVVLLTEPVLQEGPQALLQQIVAEHRNVDRLTEAGLAPTRTALFVGEPGVGKTLSARWIARELELPLLVLDLSAVMSSFLGKTGVNVRRVLEYARANRSVLLLDELDAVAKRRDDATEIGELKRLVTVLLQEIDSWPEGSLLIAATNHAELLDPAVWRRFEVVVDFPLPSKVEIKRALIDLLDEPSLDPAMFDLFASMYEGESLSTVEREVLRVRRRAAMLDLDITAALLGAARERFTQLSAHERGPAAVRLQQQTGLSQRAIHEVTGVSRDTLRKHMQLMKGEVR